MNMLDELGYGIKLVCEKRDEGKDALLNDKETYSLSRPG